MKAPDIDLPLSIEEAHVLSFHLSLIRKHEVFAILLERKLTNNFDGDVLAKVNDRLFDIVGRALAAGTEANVNGRVSEI